jgi:hypothetical protein
MRSCRHLTGSRMPWPRHHDVIIRCGTLAQPHRGLKKRHYDLIVVGSGGGAKVATPSHQLGFSVAVAEHG